MLKGSYVCTTKDQITDAVKKLDTPIFMRAKRSDGKIAFGYIDNRQPAHVSISELVVFLEDNGTKNYEVHIDSMYAFIEKSIPKEGQTVVVKEQQPGMDIGSVSVMHTPSLKDMPQN